MTSTSPTVPVTLRTGWIDFSPALHWHAARSLALAVRPFAASVRAVTVDLTPHAPGDLAARRCTVTIGLQPSGVLTTMVSGTELRELIDRAAAALVTELRAECATRSTAEQVARIA